MKKVFAYPLFFTPPHHPQPCLGVSRHHDTGDTAFPAIKSPYTP